MDKNPSLDSIEPPNQTPSASPKTLVKNLSKPSLDADHLMLTHQRMSRSDER